MQGKVASPSGYDPLDLFADDLTRQKQALESLIADPQNNLRAWVGSDPVHTDQISAWVTNQQPNMPYILLVRALDVPLLLETVDFGIRFAAITSTTCKCQALDAGNSEPDRSAQVPACCPTSG
jgi:hypothetical protein